jgi:hypothetical protein
MFRARFSPITASPMRPIFALAMRRTPSVKEEVPELKVEELKVRAQARPNEHCSAATDGISFRLEPDERR